MHKASQAVKDVSKKDQRPENRMNRESDHSQNTGCSADIPPPGIGMSVNGIENTEYDGYYYKLYLQQKLLAELSLKLNSNHNHHQNIEQALCILGSDTDVSRVYLFEDQTDGIHTRNTFEWCNADIPSHKHLFEALSYELFPSLKRLLTEEGMVYLSEHAAIPDDLKYLFHGSDVKSVILLPIFVKSEYYGFLGFDDCRSLREWMPDEIDFFRTVARIFSGTLERKLIQRKLEDSELRLMLALRIPMEGMWDWNVTTGYVHFSDTWCQMLGYEPDSFEPNVAAWRNLVHPDDIFDASEKLEYHLRNQTPFYESVHRIKSRDGKWKWILDRGITVRRDQNGRPARVIGTHTDISAQKQTEEELKKSIEVRNKLFSIIAHDLRGHISNFLPALNIISDKEVHDEEFKSEILQGLKKASFNTFNLLENLLNWARYQTDKIRLKKTVFSISELIEHNVELFESYFIQKALTINVNSTGEYYVIADKESINLIIRNLISNAVKFTPRGGEIGLFIKGNSGQIYLSVRDTGLGIPEEIQRNLFKKDIIQSTYGTEKEKGAGLGLMLCKEFAELNGGDITVESIPGMGTIFTVILKSADNQHKTDRKTEKNNLAGNDLSSKRILIVEDEQFNLFFIKSLMKEWKLNYVISENGEDALELLQNETFDLVLLDLELPVMDGYSFLRELRERVKRQVTVFAMSANDDSDAIENAYSAGADDYITKPYQPEFLYDKIMQTFRNSYSEISEECRKKRSTRNQNKKWSNLTRLTKTLGDDQKMVKSMIHKFLEITPAYYKEIIEAYEGGDYITIRNSSHKIKSSIELLAEKSIVANIKLINQYAASEKDIPKLKPLIKFFTETFPLLCTELRSKANNM